MTAGRTREVRREADGELLGFVAEDGAEWLALTVFEGLLARCGSAAEAVGVVRERGLASLSERWSWYSRRSGDWRVVLPQEAHPGRVRVAVGWYSLPGVETATITADDLAAGDRLVLGPADDVTTDV